MIGVLKRHGGRVDLKNPGAVACTYGPLITRRSRTAVATLCASRALGFWTDHRVARLMEVARSYSNHVAGLRELSVALQDAEEACRQAGVSMGCPTWTIFEGLRAGHAIAESRSAHIATRGIRWALGLSGGVAPPAPASWAVLRSWMDHARGPVICDADWRTSDVLALARLVRETGDSDVLPILGDALEEAGCQDPRILDHCRGLGPHSRACWVPDLILE